MSEDSRAKIKVRVNGVECEGEVDHRLLLVDFIRDHLGLTGTHIGCITGKCGCCTILYNGRAVKSCMLYALQADGAEIMTVEGLAKDGQLHPLQSAFNEKHSLQCGFCTPGFLMAAYDLLQRNPNPTRDQVRRAISGNICRCTGYIKILDGVEEAAARMRAKGGGV